MADNVAITPGIGATIACDEVVDGTLGTVKVQYVKIMDATLDGTTKAAVGAAGLKVDGSGATQPVSGTVSANATLTAETTKVIGVVRAADGSGNLLTSTANALDINIKSGVTVGQKTMALSGPAVFASDQSSVPFAQDTSQLFNGNAGVPLTPVQAKVNITTATTTTVVALVAAKKIRVLALYLVTNGANNVNMQSHTTTANGDSPLDFSANGGLVLNFNPFGWFDTTVGEALDIVTSAATQLSGRIIYVAV